MALVYLELFNGRRSIDEQMRTFGTKGPVLGPFPFLQTAYGDSLKFDRSVVVELVQGLIFYGGTFYGCLVCDRFRYGLPKRGHATTPRNF
jgi:hypothetical protein